MTKVLIGVLVVCVSIIGWLGWAYQLRSTQLDIARADALHWRSEADIVVGRLAQAISAQKAAEDEAARFAAKAQEYDDLRASLDGVDDAPIPDWLRDYLRRLLASSTRPDPRGSPRGTVQSAPALLGNEP